MQDFNVQPPGTVTLALNQMKNATFNCECTGCFPYWSLENEGIRIATNDNDDTDSFIERGITYRSTSDSTTVITIPDRAENNNTLISCAAFISGGSEFSDPPVKLIIIGELE
jgi:hypothetical protein